MTVQDYNPFVERMIFKYEGNYGWDRNDSGGPTKYGITCYDLAQHLGVKMNSMEAWAPRVKAMSLATADEIYRTKYAVACQFDALNAGCDCVVFDFGVNSGPSRAIRYSQMIVQVTADGVFGPITLQAINAQDPATFVNKLCNARLSFLRHLGTWGTFGRGWSARVRDLRQYSLALIKPPETTPLGTPEAKAHRIPKAFAKAYSNEETA